MSLLSFDPKSLDQATIYKMMIGTIVPRPIAFVSTISSTGIGNLAPFSFFNGVGSKPPSLMFSITRKSSGAKKDTLVNIEANGEFVVNFVSESIIQQVNQCSAEYPYGVDEMTKVGLTPLASVKVKPKRVAESLAQFECRKIGSLEVGSGDVGSATIVVGEIIQVHLSEKIYDVQKGRVNVKALNPISRLAGMEYGHTTDIFEIPRPKL